MEKDIDKALMPRASAAVESPLPSPVIQALQAGNKIQAIKLLREQTAMSLKEAKDAVEAVEYTSAQETPHLSPGEEPKSRKNFWWFLTFLVVICLSLFYYFKLLS